MAHIIRSIKNMIGRYYRSVWEECDRDMAFELCNRIRRHIGVPEYSRRKFEEGYQYRTIFHEDFKEAKEEFLNLVFGWW